MARSLLSLWQKGPGKEFGDLIRPRSQNGLDQEVPGKNETSKIILDFAHKISNHWLHFEIAAKGSIFTEELGVDARRIGAGSWRQSSDGRQMGIGIKEASSNGTQFYGVYSQEQRKEGSKDWQKRKVRVTTNEGKGGE